MTREDLDDADSVQQQTDQPWEYEDPRGIRITDPTWDCPDCGENGRLMYRPGSKNTCATCFHVVNGRNNESELADLGVSYRTGQLLLAEMGEQWHGTPGDVSNRLRSLIGGPEAVQSAADEYGEV